MQNEYAGAKEVLSGLGLLMDELGEENKKTGKIMELSEIHAMQSKESYMSGNPYGIPLDFIHPMENTGTFRVSRYVLEAI